MQFVKKNKFIQIILSFWTWIIFYPLFNSNLEILVLLMMHIASLMNLYLLEFTLKKYIINIYKDNNTQSINKFMIFSLIILKFAILISAILFGIHLIGNKIIISVINYVLLIFTISGFAIINQQGDR